MDVCVHELNQSAEKFNYSDVYKYQNIWMKKAFRFHLDFLDCVNVSVQV